MNITWEEFKREIEYSQCLLEQNNRLQNEIEELRNDYADVLDELERFKAIIKTIMPEIIED